MCVVQRDIHQNFHSITQLKILKERLSVLIVIKSITKSQVQLLSSKITWDLLSRGPLVTFIYLFTFIQSQFEIFTVKTIKQCTVYLLSRGTCELRRAVMM